VGVVEDEEEAHRAVEVVEVGEVETEVGPVLLTSYITGMTFSTRTLTNRDGL
jgi:hypothetical protein